MSSKNNKKAIIRILLWLVLVPFPVDLIYTKQFFSKLLESLTSFICWVTGNIFIFEFFRGDLDIDKLETVCLVFFIPAFLPSVILRFRTLFQYLKLLETD